MLNYIRTHFHPLWRIRRIRWLHRILKSVDCSCSFLDKNLNLRIFIYWYRDLPYLFKGARIILERNESVYVLETYNMELLDNLAGFNNTIYKIDEASNYIIIPSRFDLLIEVIGSKYTLYDA